MMTTNNQAHSLHFRSLRREKGLTLQAVASAAGFSSPTSVYLFEIGTIVDHETKQRIIQAFSQLTGESYTVSDFEPEYAPEKQPTVTLNPIGRSHAFGGGSRDIHE